MAPVKAAVVGHTLVETVEMQHRRSPQAVDTEPGEMDFAEHIAAEQAVAANMLAGHKPAPLAADRTHTEGVLAELVAGGVLAGMDLTHKSYSKVAGIVEATELPF